MPVEVVTTCDDCGFEDRARQGGYNERIRPPEGWQNRYVGAVMLTRCPACVTAISTAESAAIAQAIEERRRIVAEARAASGAVGATAAAASGMGAVISSAMQRETEG